MMDTMIWALVKMVLALGVVCGVLFLAARLLRRNGLSGGEAFPDSRIRILMTRPIAPQKYISLVQIGEEVLALGISEAQITFLTRIENKGFLEKIEDGRPARPELFSFFNRFQQVALRPGRSRMRGWWKFYGR